MPASILPRLGRALAVAAALATALLSASFRADAVPEPAAHRDPSKPADGAMQIVVFETEDCLYCSLFRRHVMPAYAASPRSREVPLRFLDLNAPDADEVGLDAPVELLPTAVLLRNNREIGRIPGYVAPETFFHAVSHLMGRLD